VSFSGFLFLFLFSPRGQNQGKNIPLQKHVITSGSTKLEPQSAWDFFLLTADIPEASKGGSYICADTMVSHRAEAEVEDIVPKGRTLEATPPQQ
jgi:hypothetical protein